MVGLCAHGLAIARDLHRAGIQIQAIESNPRLPGTHTNCAQVKIVPDINGPGLIQSLLDLAGPSGNVGKPVLFLTNDRMVETIADSIDLIKSAYSLSWSASSEAVSRLGSKDSLEERCEATGLRYPKSVIVDHLEGLIEQVGMLDYPMIVKPVKPLSTFKTLVVNTEQSLLKAQSTFASSLPVLAQEFIPGDDTRIRFGALYLNGGQALARFEGRKLRSRPMGHTTAAISERNDEIHRMTTRFFAGLRLSGPVSLEMKQAEDGTHWIIEPTVGRTDFWVDLCNANGVRLPLIEYASQVCGDRSTTSYQTDRHVWINSERDPAALPWLALNHPAVLVGRRLRGIYLSRADSKPFLAATWTMLRRLPRRAVGKVRRTFGTTA